MKPKLQHLSPSRVRFSVSVDGKDLVKYFEHSLESQGANVQLPGFRPGKAPRALLIETIGMTRLQQHALEHAIPEGYYRALKMHKLDPIGQPAVTIEKHGDFSTGREPLVFTVEVDVLPPVKISGWEHIKLPKAPPTTPTDKELQEALEFIRSQRAQVHAVDRPAKAGDRVEISFSGTLDGVPHEALQSTHYPVTIGSGALVPGFEEHLISMKKSEEKEFDITFPADYARQEFRSKVAHFTVTIEAVQETQLPPLDDELAKELGTKSVSELKTKLQQQLEKEKEAYARHRNIDAILDFLATKTKVSLPQSLVDREVERLTNRLGEQLKARNQTIEDYLKIAQKTAEQHQKELHESAERATTISLALRTIGLAAKLPLKEEGDAQKVLDHLLKGAQKA